MPDNNNEELPPPVPEKSEVFQYYLQQGKQLSDNHPQEFDKFVEGKEKLVEFGDQRLSQSDGTGYNILQSEQDMPLASGNMLIFYSNYINRIEHFALLLSEMEREGIIVREDISFGIKASKVVYTGGWEVSPDEEVKTMLIIDKEGKISQGRINKTVETVVKFIPKDETQATRILSFLTERADSTKPNAISQSWEVPDIRITESLKSVIEDDKRFQQTVANILTSSDGSQLVIMRQQSELGEPFKSAKIPVNEKLATYFISAGVAP